MSYEPRGLEKPWAKRVSELKENNAALQSRIKELEDELKHHKYFSKHRLNKLRLVKWQRNKFAEDIAAIREALMDEHNSRADIIALLPAGGEIKRDGKPETMPEPIDEKTPIPVAKKEEW